MPSPTPKIQYFSDQDLLLLPVWMEQMAADGLYLKSYGYKNCLHRVVRRKTECGSSSDPSDRTAPLTYAAAPKEKTGFFSRLVLPEREKEQWEAYHWNREFETFTFVLYSNCQPNPQFPVSREETCRRVRRLSLFTDLIDNLILTALCLVAMGLAFRFLGGWENGPDPGFWPVLISMFLLAYPIPDMVRWFTGNPDPAADGGPQWRRRVRRSVCIFLLRGLFLFLIVVFCVQTRLYILLLVYIHIGIRSRRAHNQ